MAFEACEGCLSADAMSRLNAETDKVESSLTKQAEATVIALERTIEIVHEDEALFGAEYADADNQIARRKVAAIVHGTPALYWVTNRAAAEDFVNRIDCPDKAQQCLRYPAARETMARIALELQGE